MFLKGEKKTKKKQRCRELAAVAEACVLQVSFRFTSAAVLNAKKEREKRLR